MRYTVCVLALCLLAAAAASPVSPKSVGTTPAKHAPASAVREHPARVGGETIETATVIPGLPFSDTDTTCGYIDDYDEICPYGGSAAPDVVYAYTPVVEEWLDIDLCSSSYDTKVYVYENSHTPGNPVACVDDAFDCGPLGFQSRISGLGVTPPNTYYIVIDGFGEECGDYGLIVNSWAPCAECPPQAIVETEPECIDPTNDVWNGGCNSDPPVFHPVGPSAGTIQICGTSGTYNVSGSGQRDSDWYEIVLEQEAEIVFECVAMFDVLIGILDGRDGCPVLTFYAYDTAPICTVAGLVETLPAGTWWLWVGPANFEGVACGARYYVSLDGYSGTMIAQEGITWGTIKALYR
jgi:hypothetical protein